MHRLNDLASKLTPEQLKEVEDFAEFLVMKKTPPAVRTTDDYVDVEALVGLCEGMGGEKTDKELIREAWDAVVEKAVNPR